MQLVNGEGNKGYITSISFDDSDNAFLVELVEVADSYRPVLLDSVKENLADWRINPFVDITYENERVMKFWLLPQERIRNMYLRMTC